MIVNYNAWEDVRGLVSSLCGSPEVASGLARVVVVDNASPDPMPDDFLPLPFGAELSVRPDNGGFAVGVNAGRKSSASPWLLILNPDVVATSKLLSVLLAKIERERARPEGPPGIVGFGLKNPDGSPQPSVGVYPSLVQTLREQLIPRGRRKYQPDRHVRPGLVDWVTGACVLMNTSMLDQLGGMDEEFFLYHEEVALCRAAADAGWRVEFDPSIDVVHLRPLQNRPISPKMRLIIRHSKLLYFRKHLPKRQFLQLCRIVECESKVRGALAALMGSGTERRAWRLIGKLATNFRQGDYPTGTAVRDLAESVETRPDQ